MRRRKAGSARARKEYDRMNMNKSNREGRLLAAMAVLAVAFVVLAAVPAALDSDAATTSSRTTQTAEVDWQISATTTEAQLNEMKDGGDIYVSGKNSYLLDLTGAATLYVTKDASVKVTSNTTVTLYAVSSFDSVNKTVRYYDDSNVSVSSPSSCVISMENGGYSLGSTSYVPTAGKDQSDPQVQLNLIKATYSDRIVAWTYGMASEQSNLSVDITDDAGKDKGAAKLEIGVPTETADKAQFSMAVSDGNNAVKVGGPLLLGTAGDLQFSYGSNNFLEIKSSYALTGGMIERTKGTLDVTSFQSLTDSYPYLSNGCVTSENYIVGTTDAKLNDLKVYSSAQAATLNILRGTEFTSDFDFKSAEDAKSSYVTIPKGFKTTSLTTIKVGGAQNELNITTAQGAAYDQSQWTGGAIVVGSDSDTKIAKIALTGSIGSLTVKSYGTKVAVSAAEPIEIWGALKIADTSKTHEKSDGNCNSLTLTKGGVLASGGSIELADHVKMTVGTTYNLVALGQITGKGEIAMGTGKIQTADGTMSNINVGNNADLKAKLDSKAATKAVTDESGITYAASLGYQNLSVADMTISKDYTFPENLTVDVAKITINGTESAPTEVVVPASTVLNLVCDNYNDLGILIGSTEDNGYATLTCEGDIIGKGKVAGYGTFSLSATGNLQGIDTAGNGVFLATKDLSGTVKTLKASEVALSIPYPMYQKVVVEEGKTLTISSYQTSTWYGELEVDGTLIIDNRAVAAFGLTGAGTGAGGYMPQAAKITVTSTGKVEIRDGATMDLSNAEAVFDGTVTVAGKLIMSNDSAANVGGTLTQTSTGLISTNSNSDESVIAVDPEGKMTLGGYFAQDAADSGLRIENAGTVVIANGGVKERTGTTNADMGSAEISLTSSEATVTVDSYMVEAANGRTSSLVIDDIGVDLAKYDNVQYAVGDEPADEDDRENLDVANTIEITGSSAGSKVVGPMTITSKVESKIKVNEIDVTNILLVSGSVSASGTSAAASVALDSGDEIIIGYDSKTATYEKAVYNGSIRIADGDTLAVGAKVTVDNAGLLEVDGYLDMTAADVVPLNNSGDVEVQGKIKINSKAITGAGDIHAAEFISKEKTGTSGALTEFYNYMALDKAVSEEGVLDPDNENTDKTVTIHGIVYLERSVEVPSPVKLVFASTDYSKDKLYVGTEDDSDVLLDFDKGTEFTSAKYQVEVYGTMHFDDKSNDATVKTMCDVRVEAQDGMVRDYTNIYTALGSAEAGDTVEVTREPTDADGGSAFVTLNRSVAVGDGVTLKVASGVAPLYLEDGATLTVNGILDTENHVYAESCFDASATKDSSAIVVNGLIESAFPLTYVYVPEEGGYAKLSDGAPISGAYYRYDGKYCLSTVDIAEAVFDDIQSSELQIYGPVTAGDLEFSKGKTCSRILVANASTVSTQAKQTSLTASSVELDEVQLTVASEANLNTTVSNDSGSVIVSKLPGIVFVEKNGVLSLQGTATADKSSVLTIASGTVAAGTDQGSLVYEPAVKDNKQVTDAAGMTVASGATFQSHTGSKVSEMTVDGTFDVIKGNDMTVDTMFVNGTVRTFAGDSSAGVSTLTVGDRMYVGTDAKGATSTPAKLSGTLSLSNAVVVVRNGATVDSVAQACLDKLDKTEYYVDGSLWITVYDGTSAELIYAYKEPIITNAYFSGWSDKQSGEQIPEKSKKVIGDYAKVYALIEKNVYHVIIKADQGIGDLYLNGNIMSKGMLLIDDGWYYAYWADVATGEYQVTCKLANGYSGVAKLKNTDGSDVPDSRFKAVGTPTSEDGLSLEFQLTGIEKSGYVTPTEQKDDGGLTLSDYLLIILVVLVVVLAVIVTLRMLRK